MRTLDLGRARPGRALAALAITLFLVGCGGAAATYSGGGQPMGVATAGSGAGSGNGTGTGTGSGTDNGSGTGTDSGLSGGNANNPTDNGGNGAPVVDATRPDLLIIKTGILSLEVRDVDAAVASAATEIRGLGGYVSGSSQAGVAEGVSASITYRIPADRWEDALSALRSLATTVVAEQTQSDDVTAQVVDLAARVRNLQATERAIQAVMDKATTIDEILKVQAELTRIRGEIEGAASAKGHFEEQATYSTLTVRFGLKPQPSPSPSPTPEIVVAAPVFDAGEEAGRAAESLSGIVQRLAVVAIWFGIVWLPMLLALGLVALVGRWILGRLPRGTGRRLDTPSA